MTEDERREILAGHKRFVWTVLILLIGMPISILIAIALPRLWQHWLG